MAGTHQAAPDIGAHPPKSHYANLHENPLI
jgi:hypothetical protein